MICLTIFHPCSQIIIIDLFIQAISEAAAKKDAEEPSQAKPSTSTKPVS